MIHPNDHHGIVDGKKYIKVNGRSHEKITIHYLFGRFKSPLSS
jgi:hypothetical protein